MQQEIYHCDNGVEIKYFFSNSGKPLIVFFHGWAHSKERWRGFAINNFAAFDYLLIDLPGFGNSNFIVNEQNIFSYSQQIKGLFRSLAIQEKESFVISHSLGCCVCLELLKDINPTKVVLISAPILPIWPAIVIDHSFKVSQLLFAIGLRSKFIIYLISRLTVSKFKYIDHLMISDAQKMKAHSAVLTLRYLARINYKETIVTNNGKILMINGQKDKIISKKQAAILQEMRHKLIVKNSGHTPFIECEDLVVSKVHSFFNSMKQSF